MIHGAPSITTDCTCPVHRHHHHPANQDFILAQIPGRAAASAGSAGGASSLPVCLSLSAVTWSGAASPLLLPLLHGPSLVSEQYIGLLINASQAVRLLAVGQAPDINEAHQQQAWLSLYNTYPHRNNNPREKPPYNTAPFSVSAPYYLALTTRWITQCSCISHLSQSRTHENRNA